jgi:hypothetical protein
LKFPKFSHKRKEEPTPPEPVRVGLSRSHLADVNRIIESVPIAWIQQGRTSKKDILTAQSHEYNPNRLAAKIREADLALAATTPVLGQYAPTFGWPE